MSRTWARKSGKKKPKKPYLLALAVLLVGFTAAQAGDYAHKSGGGMPKAGDIALGGSIGLNNVLPDESCKNVPGPSTRCGQGTTIEQCDTEHPAEFGAGLSFEAWADPEWSYQAGVSFGEDFTPSAYSAAAWHVPMKESDFFTSIGLAAASGTGLMGDAGAGFQLYQGETNVQFRADYYYDLDSNGSNADRNSWGLGLAIRRKW